MRLVVLLVAVGGLAVPGCAPERFSKPAERFAASVASISTAMDASAAGLAREEVAIRDQRLIDRRVRPGLSDACEVGRTVTGPRGERLPACGLVASPGELPSVSPAWRNQVVAADIIRLLTDYAARLSDLASAESREEIEEATNAMAAALGGAVTLAATPAAGAAAAAAVKLGGQVYLETVAAARYRRLVRAVQAGQEHLPTVLRVLRPALASLSNTRIGMNTELAGRLTDRALPGRPGYAQAVGSPSAAAAQVEALQRADPTAVIDSLLEAHKKLADAIERNEGATVALMQAMGELTTRAQALEAALEAARKG